VIGNRLLLAIPVLLSRNLTFRVLSVAGSELL
jgi:hypothetical protein